MAQLPPNWNRMSPEDKALWQYLNAGDEFVDGGAPEYQWQGDLELDQLGGAPQLGRTNLDGVATDPKLLEAKMKALAALEGQAETGLSAADENALNRTSRSLASDAASNAATIEQRMARQGRAGGRLGVTMQMQAAQAAQQAAADDAAQRNAMAQEGRLQARLGAGQMAGNMSAEEYKRKAAAAQAQDVINRFNTQNTIARQEYNNRVANSAKQANFEGRQQNADRNVGANYDFRKDATGARQAGAQMQYNAAAETYNRKQLEKQRKAAQRAGIGSALGGVAGGIAGAYFGGPAGAAAGYQMGSGLGGAAAGYASGKVKGEAPFPGDDPRNDLYPAMVSADEIIIPRSAADNPAEAAAFAAQAADPLASIKNPQVREFMRQKMAAKKSLEDAQQTQDNLGYANLAGRALTDLVNANKQDVILKNRMQDLGKAPEVVEARRSAYDGSMLDRVGAQGVQRAKDDIAMANQDLDRQIQSDRLKLEDDRWHKQFEGQEAAREEAIRHNKVMERLAGNRADQPKGPTAAETKAATTKKEVDYRVNSINSALDRLEKNIKENGTFEMFGDSESRMDSDLYNVALDYAKLVDPESVAREGEVAAAQKYMLPIKGLTVKNSTAIDTINRMREQVRQRAADMNLGGGSGVGSLSAEDQAAIDWARANPKDPRAAQILKMHGG